MVAAVAESVLLWGAAGSWREGEKRHRTPWSGFKEHPANASWTRHDIQVPCTDLNGNVLELTVV